MARLWDATWVAALTEERLVRAVAPNRLIGEGRLNKDELRALRPILGEVDPDVVSRWQRPSPEDAKIEAILTQWRSHCELALALAKQDWAKRADATRNHLEAGSRRAVNDQCEVPMEAKEIAPNSAGGNFAAVTAIRGRDAGIKIAAQVLIYGALGGGGSNPDIA
jgi:hypothetical protein